MEKSSVTWPPEEPERAAVPHRPWDPGLPHAPDLVHDHERVVYVVVDEIVEDRVGLSVSPWPHADETGRLRFATMPRGVATGVTRAQLEKFLWPDPHDRREIRIGRTFAAYVKRVTAAELLERLAKRAEGAAARIEDLGEFLDRPVDLTEQGRLIAKLASYGAMLSTLPRELASKWNLEEVEP